MHKDIKNKKFGRLTPIDYIPGHNRMRSAWLCKCDCGNETIVSTDKIISGSTKSCGCLKIKYSILNKRIFQIWYNMHKRCEKNNQMDSKYYFGKGIKVCQEWDVYENFQSWALENGYADDLTIDRINTKGNYEPSNCRWITLAEQQRNKSNCHYVTINGVKKTLAEWAREIGISRSTLQYRLEKNMPTEKLLSKSMEDEQKKKIQQISETGKIVNQWNSITEAATELNVSRMAVIKWIRHDVKSRKYKNYTFKLVKE